MKNTQTARNNPSFDVQRNIMNKDTCSDGKKSFQTTHITKPNNRIRTTRFDWMIENFWAVIATEKGSITSQSWELSDRTLQDPLRFRLHLLQKSSRKGICGRRLMKSPILEQIVFAQ